MNVYDFDKTILDGDSTERFYFFCLRRFPSILKHVPSLAAAFVRYALKITDKTAFKEVMYRFLTELDDVDSLIEEFWDKNIDRVFEWYKKMHREDDVVVSASPEFLLAPACKRLGIKNLIASRVDKKTGKYTGKNCWGAEKTVRFKERFGESKIDFFCSDSLSDTPLAEMSEKSCIVTKRGELIDWSSYKPSLLSRVKHSIFSQEFAVYAAIGVVNVADCVLFSLLLSHVLGANLGFAVGYILSISLAYVFNSIFNFKQKLNFMRYIGFCLSYLPNFVIQNLCVAVFYNALSFGRTVTYILSALISTPLTFGFLKLLAFRRFSE